MNIYATVVFIWFLSEFVIQLGASYLSLVSLMREPAQSFSDLMDIDRYHQLQRYIQARTWVRIGSDASYLAVLFLFWFSGGFQSLDNWIRSWGFGPLWTGSLVIGALALGRALVALPFLTYLTFRTEAQFGFNKTTWQTFLGDLLKGFFLAIAIGGPLLASMLKLLNEGWRYSWIYAWILVASVFVLLQVLGPHIILPLFNKFEPLKDQQLQQAIASYTASVDFPLAALSVIDASSRSTKSNAFLTGFGSNHRLVLQDTLLKRHTVPEIVAVVAHEVGHYKERHIPLRVTIDILQLGSFFLLMSFVLNTEGLFQAFYVSRSSAYLGIVFCTLLYSPLAFGWSILLNWIARKQEYAADAFAAKTTGQGRDLAEVLRKLAADNLSLLVPHGFDVILNYSHPSLRDRISALAVIGEPRQSELRGHSQ
jgi:STE24 endopeptidase